MAVDAAGDAHVAWLEGDAQGACYSRCSAGQCTDPLLLTDTAFSCPSGSGNPDSQSIDISASPNGAIMLVWSEREGGLSYHSLPDGARGCVLLPDGVVAGSFSLSSQPSKDFSLAFDNSLDSIWITDFSGATWDQDPVVLGEGVHPSLLVVENGTELVVWCSASGGVEFWTEGQTEVL